MLATRQARRQADSMGKAENENPNRLASVGKWSLGVGGASVIFAAQTRPEEATSSIAAWLHFIGIDQVPSVLAGAYADVWTTLVGAILLLMAVDLWWRARPAKMAARLRLVKQPRDLADLAAEAAESDRQGDIGMARVLGKVESSPPAPRRNPTAIELLFVEREKAERQLEKLRPEGVEHALTAYAKSVEAAICQNGSREARFVTRDISQQLWPLRIAMREIEEGAGIPAPELVDTSPIVVDWRQSLDLSHNQLYIQHHRENVRKVQQLLTDLSEAKKRAERELEVINDQIKAELHRIDVERNSSPL